MNNKYRLTVLGSLEELNSLKDANCNKAILVEIDSLSYGVLVYALKTNRISFLKLNVNKTITSSEQDAHKMSTDDFEESEPEPFQVYLLNVFCLPFILLDVVCSKENIWAIGEESAIDIKPYTESALKENIQEGDDFMDIDEVQEFQQNTFELVINVHQFEKYNFHPGDIFIGCNMIDNSVAVCNINPDINKWQLKLISFNKRTTSYVQQSRIADFPLSFKKCSKLDATKSASPVISFLQSNDFGYNVIKEIFGVNCSSLDIMCLIGHPDGKILCSLFDYNNKSSSSLEPLILYDIKQPIIGLHVTKKFCDFEDGEFLIAIGILGKITVFSSKRHPSFNLSPDKKSFWILTAYLKSSIACTAIINDCLLYSSNDGSLWTTDLSELILDSNSGKVNAISMPCEMFGVKELITVNERKGLVLLRTEPGNMYLAICRKESSSVSNNSSLPSLMNECLQQSITMQQLLHAKNLQSKFFSAVSTFASLKFMENVMKEPITFSITEVNLQPKKFMLVLDLQCLKNLHLDSDLYYVSASVFTYFQNDYTLVSKTVPYNPDHPTLCLELTDTVLQPPFVSIFPLFVEVGIILQLPEEWLLMDCFKLVSSCLPLYLRIQTFMIHELHLFQSNALCLPQSFNHDESKLSLTVIKQLGMGRPISNLLKVQSKKTFNFPLHFNFCLSASTVEEMMKGTGDSNPCEYIQKLLLNNPKSNSNDGNSFISKNSLMTISVNRKNSMLLITITANSFVSLLDLRMAVMDILFTTQNKCITNSSAYINIPASIQQKCEDMTKNLLSISDQDVESDEIFETILQSYQELRKNISEKLPVL